MREHCPLPAKNICNALLEHALRKDDDVRQIGEQDLIDDKTVFICLIKKGESTRNLSLF
jgi:hypothetical protein